MDSSPVSPFVVSQKCRDFDEFAEAARGWDLDFRQLDSGPFRSELVQVATSTVNMGRVKQNRLLDRYGAPPSDLRTFALLSEDSSPVVWRGHDIPEDALVVYPVAGDAHTVTRPGFHAYTVSFSEEILARAAEALELPSVEKLISGAEVLRCDHATITGLRAWLEAFCDAVSQGASPTAKQLTYALENDLPRRLLWTLKQGKASHGYASARVRRHAVRRAKEHIDQADGQRVTIIDLAKAAGVSERTLQYAFLEYFEVTPAAYLRNVRLNQARSDLKGSDPASTRVADVANRWGFWHMGQFAGDYRRLFGVRPSETLKAV